MGQIDDAVALLGSSAKAFWKLDEAVGSTICVDSVGNHDLTAGATAELGVTGLLVNDPATAASVPGGTNGKFTSTWTPGELPTTATVFVVLKADTSSPSLHECAVAFYLSSTVRSSMFFKRNTSPYRMAIWNADTTSQWLECDTANGVLARDTRYTLAWTHTATAVKFFINGVLEATKARSKPLTGTYTNVLVGVSTTAGADCYRGDISSVLIASELTDQQVLDLHTAASVATADTTAPTVPTGLAVTSTTTTGGTVSWTASTDAVGVTGYQVAVNGTPVGTTAGTSYDITGLSSSTSYTVTARAYDAAENYSAYSSGVALLTLTPVPTGWHLASVKNSNGSTWSGITIKESDGSAFTTRRLFESDAVARSTYFGACPVLGGSSYSDAETVVTKWGTNAAVRQFFSGGFTAAPNHPTGASIVHTSYKPDITALLAGTYDATIRTYAQNLTPGDVIEIWHEADLKVRQSSMTLANAIAAKNYFYDRVKEGNPDALVATTYTGWLFEPNSGLNPDVYSGIKADLLGLDLDGIHVSSPPYPSYSSEIPRGQTYAAAWGMLGWCAPEFGTSRAASGDTDGSVRAAWITTYGEMAIAYDAWYMMAYEYNSTANNEFNLPTEIAAWESLVDQA